MAAFLKILVIAPYLIGGLGSYLCARSMFKSIKRINLSYLKLAALLVAVLYMTNIWMIDRQGHYFIQAGYAFLPLTLLCFHKALQARKFIYIFLAALFLAVGTITPHFLVYTLIATGILFIVYLISDLKSRQFRKALKVVGITLTVVSLFIIFSSFWLLPLLGATLSAGETPTPSYLLRSGDIIAANQGLTVVSTFRLATPGFEFAVTRNVWQVIALVFPVIALLGFVFNQRNKFAIFFLLVAIAGLILPLIFLLDSNTYFNLMCSSRFSWLLHDPGRTLGLTAMGYCFLAGFFLLRFTPKLEQRSNE